MGISLVAFMVISSFCEVLSSPHLKTDVPGRCPSRCSSKVGMVFKTCKDKFNSGCTMTYCDSSKRVSCRLKPGIPSFLYPGEQLQLWKPRMGQKYTFAVDFSQTRARTDVYLLCDATGSMTSAFEGLRDDFQVLYDSMKEFSDVAVGLGIFRDEMELRHGFKNLQRVTSSAEKVAIALGTVEAKGGHDGPEANLVALYKAATERSIGWRRNAHRVVLYIGDNPGHEPTCVAGKRLTRRKVVDTLKRAGITVIAVSMTPGLNGRTYRYGCAKGNAGPGQGSFIASRTGGLTLFAEGVQLSIPDVVSAVHGITKKLSVTSNKCDSHVDLLFDPPLPRVLADNETLKLTFILSTPPCTPAKPETCNVLFTESGIELPKIGIALMGGKDVC